jgi:cellulose synthase (UDP-forming)
MSPKLLLSLWRERWGKPFSTTFLLPPLQGKLNQWGDQLVHASAWAYPGAAIVAWVVCIFVLLLTMSIQFSLGGQVAFSLLFIGVAVYVRRFNGTLVFLTLLGFCCIVSTRYLYWRFTETLSHSFNADFVLGFCLCAAELYLWLLLMLRAIKGMCPITTTQFSLPNDTNDWPSVDVLILGGEHSRATIEKAAVAALAFDWPKNSISIKILDDISRSDIADLAQTMGIKYGAYPDNTNGKAGCINRALAEATGELLAVVDCTQTLDKNFLQLVSGWFVQSPSLGMLQTPVHFLAPAPKSNNLALLTEPGVNCKKLATHMPTST